MKETMLKYQTNNKQQTTTTTKEKEKNIFFFLPFNRLMSPLTNSKGLTSLDTNSSPGTTGTMSPRPSDVPARRQRRTARSKKARSKSVEVSKSLSSKEERAASPTERVLKDLVVVVVSERVKGEEVKGVTVEMDGRVEVRVGRETSEVALRRRARIFFGGLVGWVGRLMDVPSSGLLMILAKFPGIFGVNHFFLISFVTSY